MVGGGRAIGWEEKEHHWRRAPGLLVTLSQAWQLLSFLGRQSGVITGQVANTYHLSDLRGASDHSTPSLSLLMFCVGAPPTASCLRELQAQVLMLSYLSPMLCPEDTAVGKTSTSACPA